MAVKFLKRGRFQITCPYCKCEFEFAPSDMSYSIYEKYFIACPEPECKTKFWYNDKGEFSLCQDKILV